MTHCFSENVAILCMNIHLHYWLADHVRYGFALSARFYSLARILWPSWSETCRGLYLSSRPFWVPFSVYHLCGLLHRIEKPVTPSCLSWHISGWELLILLVCEETCDRHCCFKRVFIRKWKRQGHCNKRWLEQRTSIFLKSLSFCTNCLCQARAQNWGPPSW